MATSNSSNSYRRQGPWLGRVPDEIVDDVAGVFVEIWEKNLTLYFMVSQWEYHGILICDS